jgi:hypothetical protein
VQFLLGQFIQLHLFRLIKILLWPLCIRPEENSELTFSTLLLLTHAAAATAAAAATYICILNASTSATVGTVRSSVRLQEHHHPFQHNVKILIFDSDDNLLQ